MRNQAITRYWNEHYRDGDTHICVLCSNSGKISISKTTRKIVPCICPHGHVLRVSQRVRRRRGTFIPISHWFAIAPDQLPE